MSIYSKNHTYHEIDEKSGPKILWIFFKYLVDKTAKKSEPKILWICFKYLVESCLGKKIAKLFLSCHSN